MLKSTLYLRILPINFNAAEARFQVYSGGWRFVRAFYGRCGLPSARREHIAGKDLVGVPGYQQEIDAGIERSLHRAAQARVLDRAHGKIVCDGDASKPPAVPEEPADHAPGLRHRDGCVDASQGDMREQDSRAGVFSDGFEGQPVSGSQCLHRRIEVGCEEMRVGGDAPEAGKVFCCGDDVLTEQTLCDA
jgi:hypothetical protein